MRTKFPQNNVSALGKVLDARVDFTTTGNLSGRAIGLNAFRHVIDQRGSWAGDHPQWRATFVPREEYGIRHDPVEDISFAVFSFSTPIAAYSDEHGWLVDLRASHYSSRSSRAVSSLRAALREREIPVIEIGREDFIGTVLLTPHQRDVVRDGYRNFGGRLDKFQKPLRPITIRKLRELGLVEDSRLALTRHGRHVASWL